MDALFWGVPVVLVLVAGDRAARARRTRRQTVDALAKVAELTGGVPHGVRSHAADVARAVVRRVGAGGDPAVAATAARLHGLAPEVLTESGICPETAALVTEVANAPRGRAQGAAAAVRVAVTYAGAGGGDAVYRSGALFRAVVEHPAGDERRAAEALVRVVQGGSAPA